jgi:hypothetical protein
MARTSKDASIGKLTAAAYQIPMDNPEADGTMAWTYTTLVLVEVEGLFVDANGAFLQVAALCEAHHIDLSGHCGPAIHLHAACAAPRFRHLEWFHDHVRIEHMLFDGAPTPRDGVIRPDLSRPDVGLAFKRNDAAKYRT